MTVALAESTPSVEEDSTTQPVLSISVPQPESTPSLAAAHIRFGTRTLTIETDVINSNPLSALLESLRSELERFMQHLPEEPATLLRWHPHHSGYMPIPKPASNQLRTEAILHVYSKASTGGKPPVHLHLLNHMHDQPIHNNVQQRLKEHATALRDAFAEWKSTLDGDL